MAPPVTRPGPSLFERIGPAATRHGPWVSVVLLAAWLLWPVPTGAMPMSADHTVHLTRIWMWAGELSQGQLRGWSTVWFFGTPVGELYPVLGDALIIAVRIASLGVLDWSGAYALGFFVVFAVQGLAMLRVGRATGLGPWPGLIAAGLVLCDVGAYREGGWLYTVEYGVWPQALSTSLCWLAFGELLVACTATDDKTVRRRIATSALAFGGSLLAHPMALLSTAIGGPLLVIVLGVSGRAALKTTAARASVAATLGVLISAWWLVPMLAHRGWMASYGWMWRSFASMAKHAGDGHFAQAMPTAVGTTIAVGIALVAVAGSRPARFLVAYGLVLWMMASKEALWSLRLDQISSGFAHIQYQRFITAAKPGLFLAAGIGVAMLVQWGRSLAKAQGRATWARPAAYALWAVAAAATLWMANAMRAPMDKYGVGRVQTERVVGKPERQADFDGVMAFLEREFEKSDRPWRTTFNASRNVHWFMDAPVYSGVPSYKQGFTPGDNFVHKPESGRSAMLDRLGVRYVVKEGRRGGRSKVVAEFGELSVIERPHWRKSGSAWLEGAGRVELTVDDIEGGLVQGTIDQSGGETRLVFAIGGFPRWELLHNGEPVEWIEVPVRGRGPSATQADRRAGRLRGGKAAGDDGSEPTLLAADVGDGTFELRYRTTTLRDALALLGSAVALGFAIALLLGDRARRPQGWIDAVVEHARVLGHPATLSVLVLAAGLFAANQWRKGAAEERGRAIAWVADGRAKVEGRARTRPFKTDMLIQPAVVVPGRRKEPAVVVFPGVPLGTELRGWLAIDDDASKLPRKGNHRATIEVGDGGAWSVLRAWKVPHRGGTTPIALPTTEWAGRTVDLRVTIESDGERPPPLGFDLELSGEVGDG